MRSTSIRLLAALTLAGCSSSSPTSSGEDKAPSKPATGDAAPAAESAPVRPKKVPRGAAAYTGEREVKTEGLGTAPAATLVASDGSKVELASVVAAGPTVLVFYRGHW